jgi:hypothetical protein
MSIARKLALLLALALAAAAVSAASASAVTVSPTGDYSLSEHGDGFLVSNTGATVSCTESNATATILSDGTVTLDTLTFDGCTESLGGQSCTVSVDTLPANLQLNSATTWTLVSEPEAATISCVGGVVHCEASVDTTLAGTQATRTEATVTAETTNPATNGTEPEFAVVSGGSNNVNIGLTSTQCGTAAAWDAGWTVDSPLTYTIQ